MKHFAPLRRIFSLFWQGWDYNSAMTEENFNNALQALRDRRPFQVFTVELVSGDRFEVDFPGALAFRDGVAVFFRPGGAPVLFDHESISQIIGERNAAA
jgi:hypothetical protein